MPENVTAMVKKQVLAFESVEEFWESITPDSRDQVGERVYRGQANSLWPLVPRVLRATPGAGKGSTIFGRVNVADQIQYEAIFLAHFMQECDRIGLALPNDSLARRKQMRNVATAVAEFKDAPQSWPSEMWIEIMALAQHHGVPTRLLDWSRRAQVAAYFAAADALEKTAKLPLGTRLAVWGLATWRIEELTAIKEDSHTQLLRIHGDPGFGDEIPPVPLPGISFIAMPGATSVHLAGQSGVFTLQNEQGTKLDPVKTVSLDEYLTKLPPEISTEVGPRLKVWTLPVDKAPHLLRLCERHDITAATIYRSYDGAGRSTMDLFRRALPSIRTLPGPLPDPTQT
jgi:hypothetical protein